MQVIIANFLPMFPCGKRRWRSGYPLTSVVFRVGKVSVSLSSSFVLVTVYVIHAVQLHESAKSFIGSTQRQVGRVLVFPTNRGVSSLDLIMPSR